MESPREGAALDLASVIFCSFSSLALSSLAFFAFSHLMKKRRKNKSCQSRAGRIHTTTDMHPHHNRYAWREVVTKTRIAESEDHQENR